MCLEKAGAESNKDSAEGFLRIQIESRMKRFNEDLIAVHRKSSGAGSNKDAEILDMKPRELKLLILSIW